MSTGDPTNIPVINGDPPPTGRGLLYYPKKLFFLWLRADPFIALGVGGITVWQMPTHYEHVRWLLLAALLGFGVWIAERILNRHKTISNYVGQAIFLNICWFLLPFYIRSSSFSPGHIATLALLGALAIVFTWNPWFHYAERFRLLRAFIRCTALFYALNMALPTVFGVTLQLAWWSSTAIAGICFVATAVKRSKPRWFARAGMFAGIVALGWFWQPFFQPVPMYVNDVQWSPEIPPELEQLPASLTLQSTIRAPQGLRESLEHRWIFNGELLDRVPLSLTGGRLEGFRTRSRKQNWPTPNAGRWRVEIRTIDGRLLGATDFKVRKQ
jgi:hypothetical protein